MVAEEGSAKDQRMEAILNNPIALCVFLRLTNLEDRLRALRPVCSALTLLPWNRAKHANRIVAARIDVSKLNSVYMDTAQDEAARSMNE